MRQLDKDVLEILRNSSKPLSDHELRFEVHKLWHKRQNQSFIGIWWPRSIFRIQGPTLEDVNAATRRLAKGHPNLKRQRVRLRDSNYEHTA